MIDKAKLIGILVGIGAAYTMGAILEYHIEVQQDQDRLIPNNLTIHGEESSGIEITGAEICYHRAIHPLLFFIQAEPICGPLEVVREFEGDAA